MKHHLDRQHYLEILSLGMHNTIQYTKEQHTNSNNAQKCTGEMHVHLFKQICQ